MTTTASENPRPAGPRVRGPRVTSTPRARRPAEPPRAGTRRPAPTRRLRLGAVPADPVPTPGRPLAPAPAAPARLPDPTAMCGSVVRAAVEVLRGERPAAHLARWVTPAVLDQLVHRAQLVRARHDEARVGVPVTVRRIRTVRLGDSTAEATVVLEDSGRVRAAAVRLEARRGVWRVAVLELG
jgi:hypothetical protein